MSRRRFPEKVLFAPLVAKVCRAGWRGDAALAAAWETTEQVRAQYTKGMTQNSSGGYIAKDLGPSMAKEWREL